MVNNKVKLGLMVALAFIFVTATIIFTSAKNRSTPYKATTTIDPDTGETIVNDTNNHEQIGNDAFITLQGSDKVYNAMTSQQFSLLRDLIGEYVRGSIAGDIQAVKVLPDTVKVNADETVVTFQMKVDKPATSLSATVTIYRTEAVRLVARNNTKPGSADHDSGLTYVNESTNDEEYGGDGAPPEEIGN